jgi:16S rRNA (cytosine1402-N4)-methyltransferase
MLAEGLRMSPADWCHGEPPAAVSPSHTADERPFEHRPFEHRPFEHRPFEHRPFEHRPVMLEEVTDIFSVVPEGVVLDATVGAGGHAGALLQAVPRLSVVGIDRDAEAVAAATVALAPFGPRARVVRGRFDQLGRVLDSLGVGQLTGALFDLGVSSPQFDTPERGFSYRFDAPLDMRMDRSQELTAARVLNESTEDELARLFSDHGEPRFARRIAAAVIAARPVRTTRQLAEVVSSAVPAAARRRGHPAKRVFQALRVAVNSELEILPGAIDGAIERLMAGGRIVVISYHSGEDRTIKDRLADAATGGCTCPPGLPCVCGATPRVRLLNRGARKPSAAEVMANPRAASARLRAAEALAVADRPVR